MRPSLWHPPIELSMAERTIIKRIRRAKLFVFLRHHRHELFTDAFQQELATLYKEKFPRLSAGTPSPTGAGDDPASLYARVR